RELSGEIAVDHIQDHSGHKSGSLEEQHFLKLSGHVSEHIAQQLRLGIPPDRIVRNCNAVWSDRNERKNVTQDVLNIKSKVFKTTGLEAQDVDLTDSLIRNMLQ
ncbi:hypothetical protein BVRB_040590, partial [Beta vulgaris subsp. vulgaris]